MGPDDLKKAITEAVSQAVKLTQPSQRQVCSEHRSFVDALGHLVGETEKQTAQLGKIEETVTKTREDVIEHHSWHAGKENGKTVTQRGASEILRWILGVLAILGTIIGAVWALTVQLRPDPVQQFKVFDQLMDYRNAKNAAVKAGAPAPPPPAIGK